MRHDEDNPAMTGSEMVESPTKGVLPRIDGGGSENEKSMTSCS